MRPQAWAICERLMAAQDYPGPVRWVIVDDGPQAQPVTFRRSGWSLEVVRPEPFWRAGENTQARNLLAGLAGLPQDARVAIIEDDDWYAPDWLTTVERELDCAELVGERRSRYYNLSVRRGRELPNSSHASLCSTALRGGAIDALRWACRSGETFIDKLLWQQHRSKHLFDGHRVVGIKGLPGRPGIGIGHRPEFRGHEDPNGALLRQWIGKDVVLYGG